jgi:rhodanese-related sulfurtransferase
VLFRKASTPRLSAAELDAQRDRFLILDIREPHEWAAGHIDGSQHLPMDTLLRDPGQVPKDRPLALVCRSGNRSAFAAQRLAALGFEVTDLEGGLVAWARTGLPLASGRAA